MIRRKNKRLLLLLLRSQVMRFLLGPFTQDPFDSVAAQLALAAPTMALLCIFNAGHLQWWMSFSPLGLYITALVKLEYEKRQPVQDALQFAGGEPEAFESWTRAAKAYVMVATPAVAVALLLYSEEGQRLCNRFWLLGRLRDFLR